MQNKIKIWIDSDACPKKVKEVIFKTAGRLNINVVMVANSHMNIPLTELITFIKVNQGDDLADQYIVEHSKARDIVITQDIPLASLLVKKEVQVINPRGEVYTEDNIAERLATRDLLKELRDGGMVTSGPAEFSQKDLIQFTNSLHKMVTATLKLS